MTTTHTMKFEAPDQGEETARADLYGLLAQLFYAPPGQALLDMIAGFPSAGDSPLQLAWNELGAACGERGEDQVRDEYESLFIGVGKPALMLYGSYYLSGFLMEKPLAALREDLASLGLVRDESMSESEDHIAALFEVMRYLIASDDMPHANLATQKLFFATHIQPWAGDMCDAVIAHPDAAFYSRVASLAKNFIEVETQAFDMS